jgi:hypothetical protein
MRDRRKSQNVRENTALSDLVHKHDTGKLTVNLVVEIAWDKPAGIEDGDRCLWHSASHSHFRFLTRKSYAYPGSFCLSGLYLTAQIEFSLYLLRYVAGGVNINSRNA